MNTTNQNVWIANQPPLAIMSSIHPRVGYIWFAIETFGHFGDRAIGEAPANVGLSLEDYNIRLWFGHTRGV